MRFTSILAARGARATSTQAPLPTLRAIGTPKAGTAGGRQVGTLLVNQTLPPRPTWDFRASAMRHRLSQRGGLSMSCPGRRFQGG